MANYLINGDTIAIHPGKHIEDYLEDEGMTQTELAKRLEVTKDQVNKLINGDIDLTEDMIAKLSDVMGTSQEYWRNLSIIYLEKRK